MLSNSVRCKMRITKNEALALVEMTAKLEKMTRLHEGLLTLGITDTQQLENRIQVQKEEINTFIIEID
jgi:hypothetical protein